MLWEGTPSQGGDEEPVMPSCPSPPAAKMEPHHCPGIPGSLGSCLLLLSPQLDVALPGQSLSLDTSAPPWAGQRAARQPQGLGSAGPEPQGLGSAPLPSAAPQPLGSGREMGNCSRSRFSSCSLPSPRSGSLPGGTAGGEKPVNLCLLFGFPLVIV